MGPKQLWARVRRSAPWRGWKRYGDARGNLLAGGVTYFSFLSVFPALALAFTIFGLVLRGQPQLVADISDYLQTALPGLIKDAAHPDGIVAISAPRATTLTVTGIVSVAGLLWAGLGWMSSLRSGVRAIFGESGEPGNVVTAKLRDLGVMVVFGVGIVVSAAVTVVANAVASTVADLVGLGDSGWVLTVVGLLLGVVLDGALVALILRVLSGVDLPWAGLRNGALLGGIGLTVIKTLGTRLIAGTLTNPVYGSIALVVGVLVWLNFIARVVLLSAALAANDLDDSHEPIPTGLSTAARAKLTEGPQLPGQPDDAPVTDSLARARQGLPTFGQRSADRAAIGAGAVLGALGAFALGGAARTAIRVIRPPRRDSAQ